MNGQFRITAIKKPKGWKWELKTDSDYKTLFPLDHELGKQIMAVKLTRSGISKTAEQGLKEALKGLACITTIDLEKDSTGYKEWIIDKGCQIMEYPKYGY